MWTFGLESSHEGPSLLQGQGGYLGELSQAGLWPQRTEGERLYQNLRPFPPSSRMRRGQVAWWSATGFKVTPPLQAAP